MLSAHLRCFGAASLAAILLLTPMASKAQDSPPSGNGLNQDKLFLPVVAADPRSSDDSAAAVVCTIAVGDEGIHYADESRTEVSPWGPSAIQIDNDGMFWIADAAANRLLQLDGDCHIHTTITLPETVTAPMDIAVTGDDIWVLDHLSPSPKILKFSRTGTVMAVQPISDDRLSLAEVSGLGVSSRSDPLLELAYGAEYRLLTDDDSLSQSQMVPAFELGTSTVQAVSSGLGSDDPTLGYVKAGNLEIPVAVENALGGLHVLGVASDGSLFVALEEVALRDSIVVDQRIYHYAADGAVLGVARAPVQEQYTHVPHALAVGRDGSVYFLATRPDAAMILRLPFSSSVAPLIPPLSKVTKASEANSALAPYVSPEATPLPNLAPSTDNAVQCSITRDTIMANANAYLNNQRAYNAANLDGQCSGRGKPQYLGGAGTYSSVPYDWGGEDSVAAYNSFMDQGKQAGDVDYSSVEACSRGVDCSGFIARVWNLSTSTDWYTGNLVNVSTRLDSILDLQRGDILNNLSSHVALFDRFGTNGFYPYEATTSWSADRVIQHLREWTWVASGGYRPYRYNSLCAADSDDGRGISANQSLNGTLSPSSDLDSYIFNGVQGQVVDIYMRRTSGDLDSYLALYDPSGTLVKTDDDSAGNANSVINYTPPATGKYRLEATSYVGRSSGGYQLQISAGSTCGGVAESAHPYVNSYNNTWTVTNANSGATSTRVHFSRIETEGGYDYVRVQDANGNTVSTYSGSYNDVYSAAVPGRTVKIQLTTDSSVTRWGFCADRIESVSTGSRPSDPSNARAVALDSTRVQVTWNDNSNNESGFRIKDGSTLIGSTGAGNTSYTATSLSPGSYHCYVVLAYNGYGESAASNWACVTTPSAGSGNLARNRAAYATTIENSNYPAPRANDGSMSTRWSSQVSSTLGDQWWWIDLGGQTYNRVVIRWEAAYAANFFVGYSDNGSSFNGWWYTASSAGSTTHQLGSRSNRYVGIMMRTRAPRMNNYSIWEVEVYRDGALVGTATAEGFEDAALSEPVTAEVTEVRSTVSGESIPADQP